MKKIIWLVIVLFGFGAHAQEVYTVIKVSGKVENAKLSRETKTGDKIGPNDALRFTTPGAYLIIISPKTGRKTIRGVPDNTPREIFQLIQSFVKPEERSTMTRTAGLAYLDQLAGSFPYNKILILGEGKISVETDKLSLKPPAGIRAQYVLGGTTLYQTISDDKAFYLNKQSLFPNATSETWPRVAIQYHKSMHDALMVPGTPIASFYPVYTNETELKSEIQTLVLALGDTPAKEINEQVKKYLVSEYGGVQDNNLNDWLRSNQLLKE